ncbi:tRNA lysidine(34) synthetase TilS [Bacillus horti]|uniref:tRNA(Ile)-lysidine synthase n=1 Tax=Caldalkalibacillus horti TaxID=77523 RepID=A0ABT9W3F1_9BACI|nr:tRNA lysidine(34) synthetase TilS [Bacillus horti]MDQ0167599.1 tRNA(Ile)-lysidine synthase [Bacillus horti]
MELDIHSFVAKHGLFQQGDSLLLAISGGVDSMALLHWFIQQREAQSLTLRVIHVNHQLRGEESERDQQHVEEMCRQWNVPCSSVRVDVVTYAREKRISKQVAARECRYQAFEQIAKQYDISIIATAHHADDQVETVLMRLIRGAGIQGLSGIPSLRRTNAYMIIRPFLKVAKKQLESYCQVHDIPYQFDQSNSMDDYTRNYVRHHVTPLLTELNPQLHEAIGDMTELLREENDWLTQEAKKYADQIIETKDAQQVTLNLSTFRHIPLPLQRRAILLILNCLSEPGSQWSKTHIDQLLELCIQEQGRKELHLPHSILVQKEYTNLTIGKRDAVQKHQVSSYYIRLPSEGELDVPELSLKIRVEAYRTALEDIQQQGKSVGKTVPDLPSEWRSLQSGQRYRAQFDLQQISLPLILRNRQPGDKIQPLGMKGHKKVKDIFIDAKIPQKERQRWPLIADQLDILWIPGIKRADRSKVNQKTEQCVVVTVEKL